MALIFLVQIFPLLPLITSARTRALAHSTLENAAKREGWPISDMELRRVLTDRSFEVIHRTHTRGRDPSACFILTLSSATPCDAPR